eukprot:scpid58771/ scgid20358/ Slit homolog 3 protein; Multiple epidermal growth factor-like domains protein 5
MSPLVFCPFVLLLLSNVVMNSHARRENGSCVATFLEEAGISSVKAADYEAKYAQQGLQADNIASTRRALVPVIGISNPSDVVQLLHCFSVPNTSCATYRFCSGKGQCVLKPSTTPSYECSCQAGYYGDECQNDMCLEDGSDSTCQNGGTCFRISAAPFYRCKCAENYVGERCERAKDHCSPHNPCAHGGRCRSLKADFLCECPRGHVGRTCQDHLLTRQEMDKSFETLERALLHRMDSLESRLLNQGEKTSEATTFTEEFTSVPTTSSSPASTPSVQAAVTLTTLRFVEESGNWYRAKERCASLGGVLAVPRNASEQDILRRLTGHTRSSYYRYMYVWLGASDLEEMGIWRRVADNVTLDYISWARSQPNNDNERCLAHRHENGPATEYNGWYDRPCGGSPHLLNGDVGFLCRLP